MLTVAGVAWDATATRGLAMAPIRAEADSIFITSRLSALMGMELASECDEARTDARVCCDERREDNIGASFISTE